ncbi:MAG: DUF2927 domain-containing protein [Lachnospiraceae bacterium]|nr:DUF2927 domain-containing protein [Lachnospiraceae bacterium]
MRFRLKMLLLTVALTAMVSVIGCIGYNSAEPTPSPTPTEEPDYIALPTDLDPEVLQMLLRPTNGAALTPGAATGTGSYFTISSRGYSIKDITDYFSDIALHTEYGTDTNCIHKWSAPILVYIKGSPTAQDLAVIQNIFRKMNSVKGFPSISETISDELANLVITFADDNEYRNITPANITDSTDGFASCWWQGASIFKAKIGIRTSISQNERNSVIWEEIVQATGLQNDSYTYPDSLFYQGYNEVQEPTTLDWILFEILYHPAITAGMSEAECLNIINEIVK